MELIEEMAKAIAANYSMKYTGRDEARACLPVVEKWLRTYKDLRAETLANGLAAMRKEAKRGT